MDQYFKTHTPNTHPTQTHTQHTHTQHTHTSNTHTPNTHTHTHTHPTHTPNTHTHPTHTHTQHPPTHTHTPNTHTHTYTPNTHTQRLTEDKQPPGCSAKYQCTQDWGCTAWCTNLTTAARGTIESARSPRGPTTPGSTTQRPHFQTVLTREALSLTCHHPPSFHHLLIDESGKRYQNTQKLVYTTKRVWQSTD